MKTSATHQSVRLSSLSETQPMDFAATSRPYDAARGAPHKPEVLIVDDEGDFSDLMRTMLEEFDVIVAEDGEQALALFKERSPDLVLTDVVMPKMNGIELIEQLAKYSQTPIVAFSGYSFLEDSYEYFVVHEVTKNFLTKPFSPEQLQDAIKKVFANKKI